MRDLAYPLAVAIVVAVPALVLATLALLSEWGRWMLRHGGELGWGGLCATYLAAAGAAAWIALDPHRGIRSSLVRVEAALLVGLVASTLVVLRVRRSAHAGGAGPAAPSR